MSAPPARPRRPSTARVSSHGSSSSSRRREAAPPPRPGLLRRWRVALELAAVITAALALVLWLSVPPVERLASRNPTTTAFIELRRAQAAAKEEPFELRWTWRPIDRISPHLRRAVVIAEDWKFWEHEGVDWNAIEDAVERGLEKGEFARGGSTITQQLAKNLYLSPERSVVRKLRELLIAFRLEDELPKARILEMYLNVAEWGDGVFGAEAAARRYYRRSAAELTPAQAARLAVALPNPFERSPAERSRAMDRKAGRILRMMRQVKAIGEADMERGLVELGVVEEKAPGPEAPVAVPEAEKPPRAEKPPGTGTGMGQATDEATVDEMPPEELVDAPDPGPTH